MFGPAWKLLDARLAPSLDERSLPTRSGAWFRLYPYQVAVTAWMRAHLMNDAAARNMFYGPTCTLCQDTQVMAQRKNMNQ